MGIGHDSKLDIWTVGILIYELLHGKPPFSPDKRINDRRLYLKCIEDKIMKGKIDFLPKVSQEAKDTILSLLKPKPEERPEAFEILKLPLFTKFNVDS